MMIGKAALTGSILCAALLLIPNFVLAQDSPATANLPPTTDPQANPQTPANPQTTTNPPDNDNTQVAPTPGNVPSWDSVEPGKGFFVAKTEYGDLYISAYVLIRYINQLPPDQTFVD